MKEEAEIKDQVNEEGEREIEGESKRIGKRRKGREKRNEKGVNGFKDRGGGGGGGGEEEFES